MRYARIEFTASGATGYQEIEGLNRVVRVADEQGNTVDVGNQIEYRVLEYDIPVPPYASPPPAPAPEPPAPDSRITRLAFRNRFTMAEKAAIEMAALDDASAPMEVRARAATLRAYIKDMEAASAVDLTHEATQAGVRLLEAAGLIASGRADEILNSSVSEFERLI